MCVQRMQLSTSKTFADLQLNLGRLTNNQLSGSLPSEWASMDQVHTSIQCLPAHDYKWCTLCGSTLNPTPEVSLQVNKMGLACMLQRLTLDCPIQMYHLPCAELNNFFDILLITLLVFFLLLFCIQPSNMVKILVKWLVVWQNQPPNDFSG